VCVGNKISRFDVILSHMMTRNIISLTNEIVDPIDEMTFHVSCILLNMLMMTCFGHCGPSSGHKNIYRGKLYRV